MSSIGRYPFGSPVGHRPPAGEGHRPLFVLGAYPSALHVRWQPPETAPVTRPIRALAVADEPSPFWPAGNAIEEASLVETWCKSVDFSPSWGTVEPAGPANGSSGRWLDEHILQPLACARQDAWITDCLDTYRLSSGQASRIADTYAPNAAALGLPRVEISPHPGEAQIVTEALATQRPRLLAELNEAAPRQVVTLGNAALRVFARLIDPSASPPPRFLTRSSYGEPVTVQVNGRSMSWLPMIHPGARFGSDSQSWPGTHQQWMAERAR
jgi:uracil-DNA glycosylase